MAQGAFMLFRRAKGNKALHLSDGFESIGCKEQDLP